MNMELTTSGIPKWVGTVEVAPRHGNSLLGTATGAYVAAVGIAHSESEFRSTIERAMGALDFELIDVEDVRRFSSETDMAGFDNTLRERVHRARVPIAAIPFLPNAKTLLTLARGETESGAGRAIGPGADDALRSRDVKDRKLALAGAAARAQWDS